MTEYSLKPEILIIDDDSEICETLELLINSLGYFVRYFTNPKQGLEYFESAKNPLVILDIQLPDISGLELLPKIKSIEKKTQVIMMTGERDIEMVLKSLQNKATDFLLKPFQMDFVESRVKKSLDRYFLLKEREDSEAQIEEDLRLAGKIQAQFQAKPTDKKKLRFENLPFRFVSGDLVQIASPDPTTTWILMGDIERHGVSSGLVGIFVATIFKEMFRVARHFTPKDVLAEINKRLCDEVGNYSMTAVCLCVDHTSGDVQYSRAGYPFPILFPALVKGKIVYNDTIGSLLGVLREANFQNSGMESRTGDILFLHSDGLLGTANHPLLGTLEHLPITEERHESFCKEVEVYISYLKSSFKVKDDISYLILEI